MEKVRKILKMNKFQQNGIKLNSNKMNRNNVQYEEFLNSDFKKDQWIENVPLKNNSCLIIQIEDIIDVSSSIGQLIDSIKLGTYKPGGILKLKLTDGYKEFIALNIEMESITLTSPLGLKVF